MKKNSRVFSMRSRWRDAEKAILAAALFCFFGLAASLPAQTVFRENFSGGTEPLSGKSAEIASVGASGATWQSATSGVTIFRGDGVVDAANAGSADRGAWFALGDNFLKPNSVYALTVAQSATGNASLFAGLQAFSGTPALTKAGQNQGTAGAGIHIRGFAGGQMIRAYKHIGGTETVVRATDLAFASPAAYRTLFFTNNLTDASVCVGNAAAAFDASGMNTLFLAFDDSGVSTGKFDKVELTRLFALPGGEDFSNCASGAAAGQIAADVSGGAQIVTEGGESLLALPACSPEPAEARYAVYAPADFGEILWFETTAKVVATETRSQFVDLDGMLVALVKDADGNVYLEAYDGRQGLANGGGRWTKLRIKNYDLRSDDFFTLTVRADYLRKKFDVFLNGELAAVNLGFDDARVQNPDVLSLYGQTDGTNYFKHIYLSDIPPATLPVSTAGDGIADAWKMRYGVSLSDATLRDADTDGNGLTLLQEYFYGLAPGESPKSVLGKTEIAGGFYRQVWNNISGNRVSQLLAATNDFQKTPDAVSLTEGSVSPANCADNYGQRIRGYVTIPETGAYTFYLRADDSAELWISTDGTSRNREKIATVPRGTIYWTTYPAQKSDAFDLKAGQRLFMEIRHKEGTSADNVRVGWTTPGKTSVAIIPKEVVSSYVFEADDQDDDDLPDSWERTYNLDTADNGLVNAANGKHGCNNTAGLDNYQCFKLGLDPRNPDIAGIVGKQSVAGVLQREVWTGLSGIYISNLTGHSKFAKTPDVKTFTPPSGISGAGINYGQRWRGWLTVPTTGEYRLHISSDNRSQLWLSPDETAANKRRIAQLDGSLPAYADSRAEQTSPLLLLEAGKRYYLEVLHKNGGGRTDHCELAWHTPEEPKTFVPVPADCIASWIDDDALNQIGYAKTWIEKYALTENSLLPDACFLSSSCLPNWQAYRAGIDPRETLDTLRAAANAGDASGFWIRDVWTSGVKTGDILANQDLFYTTPTTREVVKGGDDFVAQRGDKYAARTRGYLLAPETGYYRFSLSADESGELYLSRDATPAQALLVACAQKSARDVFDADPRQLSAPVYLEAGKKYFCETRFCEYGGDDSFQLVWSTPSNPQELVFVPASAMFVYVPPANDPNGWGYSNDWLADTGLDQLPPEQQTPWADADGDGLTNLEEYKSGLNPRLNDTDGDGVSDFEELKLAHTNPLEKDFNGTVVTIATLNGADFNKVAQPFLVAPEGNVQAGMLTPLSTGNWQIIGSSVYSADVRGTLAYTITVPANAASVPLRLVIHGGQYIPDSADKILETDVYVDAAYAGRAVLDLTKQPLDAQTLSPLDAVAQATLWLPVLPAGTHTLKLAWLNGKSGTSLRVDKLQLQQLGGTWLAARQNALSALDETPALSYTSPYCLEGGAQDAGKLTVMSNYIPSADATDAYSIFVREKFFTNEAEGSGQTGEGNSTGSLKANTALRGKYYSDIPLSPAGNADGSSATKITVFDAATGATRAKQITWLPYDLALHAGEVLTLRAGDALLLKSENEIRVTGPSDAQTLSPSAASPFVFAISGNYTITAGTDTAITVIVSSASLNMPTTLLGQTRRWTPPALPDEAVLFYDAQLHLADIAKESGKRSLSLLSTLADDQYVIARLGDMGPILASTRVNTVVNYGNPSEKMNIVSWYSDGSRLWRAQLNFGGNIPDDFRIVIDVYRAGVTFDDGTTLRTITKADLDEDGTYTYYLLHDSELGSAYGSVCRRISIFDGAARITVFER